MARDSGMSENEISSGVNSGKLDYDLAEAAGEDGSARYSVTLTTFSVGRARLFDNFLTEVGISSSAVFLKSPATIVWDSKKDGDPKLYRVGNLDIMLSSRPGTSSAFPTPVLRLSGEGFSPIEEHGEVGFEDASATVLVGRLDPAQQSDAVVFETYTGGAHCCTSIIAFDRIARSWKRLDLGTWDGEPLSSLPQDIDGDNIPDIVLGDERFLYTFAPYALSDAPPRIFNVVNGTVFDVSSEPRYVKIFRESMTMSQAGCLLHENGACAAFVASASRAGLYYWAWQFMLDNYDKTDDWQLPKLCDTTVVNGLCPDGHEVTPTDYPTALAGFLTENNYHQMASDSPTTETISPSFDCGKVHSQVLRTVCTTPDLAAADQTLAAAYYGAVSHSTTPDSIKADERAWIIQRNNNATDTDGLRAMYQARIDNLEEAARQEIAAGH